MKKDQNCKIYTRTCVDCGRVMEQVGPTCCRTGSVPPMPSGRPAAGGRRRLPRAAASSTPTPLPPGRRA